MVVVATTFEDLVQEAAKAPIDGWDFSWLDGRATEQRPSWGYQRLLGARLSSADVAVDLQTGGGEVLAGAGAENFPPTLVATEGWPPNLERASALLGPLGVSVVAHDGTTHLPFDDCSFDLATSRHPATVQWHEIARVLAPGGTYFAQHVGGRSNVEISQFFLGPFEPSLARDHEVEAEQARRSGLDVVQLRNERLALEFFDVGAMVFFLRKVVWTVPGFTVDSYWSTLRDLHRLIERYGAFRSTMSRTLVEVRKPLDDRSTPSPPVDTSGGTNPS